LKYLVKNYFSKRLSGFNADQMTTLTSNAQKFQCLVVIHANYSVAFSK